METFDFKVDQKVTIWHRTNVTIVAESLEKAKEKLEFLKIESAMQEDVPELLENVLLEDNISTEYLYNSVENLTIEENGGASTIEVMYNDEVILRNSTL